MERNHAHVLRADQVVGVKRRRVFLFLAGLMVTALRISPSPAVEPVQKVVRVGFVDPQSASTSPRGLSAFWERMRELGYVDGQNLSWRCALPKAGPSGCPRS